MATLRQIAVFDMPDNGIGHGGHGWGFSFRNPTLAGSTIIVFPSIAALNGAVITGIVDSQSNTWSLLDAIRNNTNGMHVASAVLQNAPSYSKGWCGRVGSGTSTTLTDDTLTVKGATWVTNEFVGLPYKNFDSGWTGTVTANNTTGQLTISGMGGTPQANEIYAVGDYCKTTLTGSDDYYGGVAVEVSGVASASLAGHNANQADISASGTISSGTVALGSNTYTLIGICLDDEQTTATPGVVTGFTDQGAYGTFDITAPTKLSRLVSKVVVAPSGSVDAQFSTSTAQHLQALLVALLDTSPAASLAAVSRPGPGIQPGPQRTQFFMAPRGIILPLTALAAQLGGQVGVACDLSSLRTSGGQAYIAQPGPGIGPFSNTQFAQPPRSVISQPVPLQGAAQSQAICSVTATLSQLQTSFAAASGSVISASGSLTTLAGSGGASGYLPQPGPGVSPGSLFQFAGSPRSTRPAFQSLIAAANLSGVVSVQADLATGVLLATDEAAYWTVSSAMSSGIGLSAQLQGATSVQAQPNTGVSIAASLSAATQVAPALLTSIRFAASLQQLTYVSGSVGSGAQFASTSAALASVSGAMLTAIQMSAQPSGTVTGSADFDTSIARMATALAGSTTVSADLVTSVTATVAANGATAVLPTLQTGKPLSATAQGVVSTQPDLASGNLLAANTSGNAIISAALATNPASWAAEASGSVSIAGQLSTVGAFAAVVSGRNTVIADLLTVLQAPGEFADIRWVRAPRGRGFPYAEFIQGTWEVLWYGVNWEDWLASRWEPNASAQPGQLVRPSVATGYEYACITAGQTGAVEPTWPQGLGSVMDGGVVWQAQLVSAASLDDGIASTSASAPAGITLDSVQVLNLRTYLIIDTRAATVGTNYDVVVTVDTTGGQQKVAKLRIKVR